MESKEIIEMAKATQELAKTTGSAIEAARDTGGFLAKYLNGPAEQVSLILTDRLKYARATRILRLKNKFTQEFGETTSINTLPVKFALEALEEGALEEDDELQDIWARLIANTLDANSGATPKRAYISIIKDMSRLDAQIFETIFSLPGEPNKKSIATQFLPEKAVWAPDKFNVEELVKPSDEATLSLSNLSRLGIINLGSSWGTSYFEFVSRNVIGHDLMKSLRRRNSQ